MPTIVDPEKYKYRFKRAMKRYFVGMVTQEEKLTDIKLQLGHPEHEQTVIEERSDEEDELNQTNTNIL